MLSTFHTLIGVIVCIQKKTTFLLIELALMLLKYVCANNAEYPSFSGQASETNVWMTVQTQPTSLCVTKNW